MRITKILFALLFLLFAIVQLNDPDPLLWVLIYLSMSAVSVMAAFGKYSTKLMIVMAAGYLIMTIIYFEGFADWLGSPDRRLLFDDLAKMEHPYIEEAREFLGLLICLATLLFYFWLDRKEAAGEEADSPLDNIR
jgi:hypothetical protein